MLFVKTYPEMIDLKIVQYNKQWKWLLQETNGQIPYISQKFEEYKPSFLGGKKNAVTSEGEGGGRHDVQSKLGLERVDQKCYCCGVCERTIQYRSCIAEGIERIVICVMEARVFRSLHLPSFRVQDGCTLACEMQDRIV